MLYLLMILSTVTAAGKSVIFKKIGVDSNSKTQLFRLNGISFLVAAVIAITATGFNFTKLVNISPFSFFMAMMFALSMIFTYLTQITAMSLGTASSTMLIYSCGFLIPIFFGAIAYNEEISVIQIIAIFVLLISLFLIINPEKNTKLSLKWLIFSLLSMTGSGTIAILQKIHQRSEFASEFSLLLSWAFVFAGAVLFIIMFFASKKENAPEISKHEATVGSLSGVFMGLLNLLNLRLAGKIPAVILFPTYNVGSIILSGVVCAIMFKEKNTKKQIAGFIIGCIAILFIGLF